MTTADLVLHNSAECPKCKRLGVRLYVVRPKPGVTYTSYRCLRAKPGREGERCMTEWQCREESDGEVGAWRETPRGLQPLRQGGAQF